MKPQFTPLEAALMDAGIAQSDPQRMHGTVCFVEAPRLPVEALFGNLEGGTLEEFFENYPDTISEATADAALKVQRQHLKAEPAAR